MTVITSGGSLNTAALTVPDLYVQIQTAGTTSLSGAQTNIIGVVGTASWGPIGVPIVFGTSQERVIAFRLSNTSTYDLGTVVSTAIAQGASSFVGVRVTDGTDTAASYALLYNADKSSYPVLLTAACTGSAGNTITLNLIAGSAQGSWKLVLQMPNHLPEVFDNLHFSSGSVSFWQDLVNAVNNGQSSIRGPSSLVIASLGKGTDTTPVEISNQSMMNGTDGNSNVTAQMLVGSDGLSRSGMYALQQQSCSIGILSGVYDASTWSTQAEFGISEGIYMITCTVSGDTVTGALTTRAAAGVDSYALKIMFGDWLYWYDAENASTRLVSPQGFVAGKLSALSPQLPSLNKQMYGIVGSQKSGLVNSGQTATYSTAELTSLLGNGIDVICNPAPGGSYWAARGGINCSSNPDSDGDEYVRVTNFIAETISQGMGSFIGYAISPTLFSEIETTLSGFLSDLQSQGVIGSSNGSVAYSVNCSSSNNPQSRTSLGYLQADIQVTYFGINRKFIVNINGGAGVTVAAQS